MRWVALLMLVYVLANVVSFLVNEPSLEMVYKLLPLSTFLLFPFSYSVWTIADREEVAHAALTGAAIASFGGLAFALVQYRFLGMRAEGGAGNALVFADVICLAGLMCLAGALILETRRSLILLAAFAAAFGAVMLSGSRSVWGVMIVLTLGQLFIFRRRVLPLLRGRVLALLGIAIVIAVLTSGLIVNRFEALWHNMDRLTEGGDYNSSVGLRVAVWSTGGRLFAEDPIFGHGMQNVSSLIRERMEQNFGLEVGFTHFHNGFLTILVEGGIVAGLAIIAMFALITVIAVRSLAKAGDRLERLGGAVLLILAAVYAGGGSVNLIFGHDILDTVFMIFLIIGLFLARGTSRLADAGAPLPSR
ncbi:O-antigen ligase family protein [Nitratireductor sp. L1-7-SE]|uniref:O-antigen ligase family protein n=2 Tax=Nitratireductor rhodophyticola TaxID=2854036 RepID=A0ABS7RB50_9HYPH|nr:O-antigen ligase family protein [Nitratireductor rhodophyticola]MBY8921053.1 O-antigen ligase family protein [Nitratireductor rhodophyticola]